MISIYVRSFGRALEALRVIKETDREQLLLVRDETGRRYVLRQFSGSGAVYQALRTAHCPHTPNIEAVEEQDGQVSVLEEYIQGDTLAFLLEAGALPVDDVRRIMIQLCDALEVLHGLAIVHRDIKPENVILRGDEAVLIDFDVSRLSKPERSTDTQVMGTAGYAAPEQFGFTQTDRRADIYALGVLLNELLTRQHPSKVLVEGTFRPIVKKCLEVNMDQRYDSVTALRHDLEKTAHAGGRRIRRAILGLAILLVLGGVTLLWGGQSSSSDTPPSDTVSAVAEDWQETVEPGAVRFQYDLDGDGTAEDYFFGVGFLMEENGETLIRQIRQDEFALGLSDSQRRQVIPCVWRQTDSGPEPAADFASLLDTPSLTLWRVPPTEGEAPALESLDYDSWQGGLQMNFAAHQAGTWLYEARADLDGQPLTATAISIIRQE